MFSNFKCEKFKHNSTEYVLLVKNKTIKYIRSIYVPVARDEQVVAVDTVEACWELPGVLEKICLDPCL